jgi:pimeloyl-ACP methyl ester carboxylesterase
MLAAQTKALAPRISTTPERQAFGQVLAPALGPSELSGTIRDGDASFSVSIRRHDAGATIDPTLSTWLIIHGWNSDPTQFAELATAIETRRPADQVLVLDWRTAAAGAFPFAVEARIPLVATWAATALAEYFAGSSLNVVGHSFGSYVAGEIAERISGGVNTIVALDPATDVPGGYDPDAVGGVDFAQQSQFSWAFHDAESSHIEGHDVTPTTANEAIGVLGSSHTNIDNVLATMLLDPGGGGGANQLFQLERLLSHTSGPWTPDQFDHNGVQAGAGGYEAVITIGSGTIPQSISYVPKDIPDVPDGIPPLADVLWRDDAGTVATASGELGGAPNNSHIVAIGDFDADVDSDILWRHESGQMLIWEIQAGQHLSNLILPHGTLGWDVAGNADFDADGDADILWRHRDGAVLTWEIEDGQHVTTHRLPFAPLTLRIDGIGDFDRDGDGDILWRDRQGGVLTWEMEGGGFVRANTIATASNSWQIQGTGDFNGDGDADILWHHQHGAVTSWEMENGRYVTNHNVEVGGGSWNVEGTGDFNSDATDDVLWRHPDTGQVVVWDMRAGEYVQTRNFGIVPQAWQIQGTGEFDLV